MIDIETLTDEEWNSYTDEEKLNIMTEVALFKYQSELELQKKSLTKKAQKAFKDGFMFAWRTRGLLK
jgi:hypothetical protein